MGKGKNGENRNNTAGGGGVGEGRGGGEKTTAEIGEERRESKFNRLNLYLIVMCVIKKKQSYDAV
jgi:hypothetical protein